MSFTKRQIIFGILGLSGFIILLVVPDIEPGRPLVNRMAAVAVLVASLWIGETISIAATALIPLIVIPILKITSLDAIASTYMNKSIFLFLGGFLLALAIERWGLHRRIALKILNAAGSKPRNLLGAFMIATGVLSMWISNTATAMMMLPIALAVIEQLTFSDKSHKRQFGVAIMLGIAYSASVGGMGTLIGTPPNIVFLGIYSSTFPQGPEISFLGWMIIGLPLVLVIGLVVWQLLVLIVLHGVPEQSTAQPEIFRQEYLSLGPMSYEEKVVGSLFALTALLWLTRADLSLGRSLTIPGWASLLGLGKSVDDATVAIGMSLLLFMWPARTENARLLDWEATQKLPWGIIVLFGGGFALAYGFKTSGLSEVIGASLAHLSHLPPWLMILSTCLVMTFLTEVTSNTATTQTFLPILATTTVAMNIHPLLLMVPATLSASCAFMLPVATPPNAIVFGSGHVTIWDMSRVGIILNLLIACIITVLMLFVVSPLIID